MTDTFYDEAETTHKGRFIKVPSQLGAGFKGVLLGPPVKRPQMFKGEPVLSRKTKEQRYEHLITFQTDERDPEIEDDDGVRKFALKEGAFSAFVDAWKNAGKPNPIEGSTVACRVTKARTEANGWDDYEFKIIPGEPPKKPDTSWDDL